MKLISRVISVLLCLCAIVCLAVSCESMKYYDSDAYEEIWKLSDVRSEYGETRNGEFYRTVPPIYPGSIDGLNVSDYMCRYDLKYPLGADLQ